MDTVALLAWTAASLEDGDKHSLATSVSIYFVIYIWYVKIVKRIQDLESINKIRF